MENECMHIETKRENFTESVESDSESKSECEWTAEETSCLLELIGTCNDISQLLEDDDNDQIYVELSKSMLPHGHTRSAEDVKEEWTNLLNKYTQGSKFEHYDELHKLLNEANENTEIIMMCDDNGKSYESPEPNDKIKRWSDEETNCILDVLEKYGLPTRNTVQKITRFASISLKKHGFNRTHEQIQLRLKKLRLCYYKVARNLLSKEDFPFYDRMKELFEDYNQSLTKDQLELFLSFNGDTTKKEAEEEAEEVCENWRIGYAGTARQIWSEKETNVLLQFIETKEISEVKELKKYSTQVVQFMSEHGFERTAHQILIRWKKCRHRYFVTLRRNLKHPARVFPQFFRIQTILDKHIKAERKKEVKANFVFCDPDEASESCSFNVTDALNASDATVKSVESPIAERTEKQVLEKSCDCCSMDSVDHYCMSLSANIKKLDARRQAKLKVQIMQLMYDAEFSSDF